VSSSRAALFMAVVLTACSRSVPAQKEPVPSAAEPAGGAARAVLPDGFAVRTEIAADDATREQGLMFRDQMADDHGMIFIFPKAGLYPFWMKNTLIPLDMIWIGAEGKVVDVEASVPPCKADPCPSFGPGKTESLYVLETAAGVAAKHKVAPGAEIRLEGLDHVIVR
jgi:uncharacterized membrane protein (UPF0127 family)